VIDERFLGSAGGWQIGCNMKPDRELCVWPLLFQALTLISWDLFYFGARRHPPPPKNYLFIILFLGLTYELNLMYKTVNTVKIFESFNHRTTGIANK
jgi:hypothetical protein